MTTKSKEYLAVFLSSYSKMQEWEKLSDTERSEREDKGIQAWHAWVGKNENAITVMGSPIGPTKLVNTKGISAIENQITAYTVVRAESHEAAAKLFENHPHFAIFPGESIEVMECLPIPGESNSD